VEDLIMSDSGRGTDRTGRRSKRFLSVSQKYEIWLQLIRQEVTITEAATEHQVDRSTIMRIRTVAKEGALAALAASKPGAGAKDRDYELEAAKAEIARLGETVKEMAVKLMLVEGKAVGAEWPGPGPGRCGHQDGPAGPDRRGRHGGLAGTAGLPRTRLR
jgi:transposase